VVTRADCELCEHMVAELSALGQRYPLPAVALADVDGDPQLLQRWGRRVPVLLLDGTLVCAGRLDGAQLLRLLRL